VGVADLLGDLGRRAKFATASSWRPVSAMGMTQVALQQRDAAPATELFVEFERSSTVVVGRRDVPA
jgi:hypothetical protein